MIPIVAGLLSTLAQNGLGILSSAIQAKGKEVVESTLGVKIPDSPTAEEVESLRQLQFSHEERLLELGIEKAKQDIELAKVDAAERDSARKRETDIVTSANAPLLNKLVTPVLAIGIVAVWAYTQYNLTSGAVIDQNMRELVARVLGTLDAALMMVLSYYFGASHDHKKDVNK